MRCTFRNSKTGDFERPRQRGAAEALCVGRPAMAESIADFYYRLGFGKGQRIYLHRLLETLLTERFGFLPTAVHKEMLECANPDALRAAVLRAHQYPNVYALQLPKSKSPLADGIPSPAGCVRFENIHRQDELPLQQRQRLRAIMDDVDRELLERGAPEGELQACRGLLHELLQERYPDVPESLFYLIDGTRDVCLLQPLVREMLRWWAGSKATEKARTAEPITPDDPPRNTEK
jgi:hypothetical protein